MRGEPVAPPAPVIVRHAIKNGAAELRRSEAGLYHAQQVLIALPGGKMARIDGMGPCRADAQTGDIHAIFVGEEARQIFAESLGDAIEAVWALPDAGIETVILRIEADGVVGTRIDNRSGIVKARRFEDIIGAGDIGPKDAIEGRFI